MQMQSKLSLGAWRLLRVWAVVILGAGILGGYALAQSQAAHERIFVVAHVDFIPPQKEVGTKLVKQYLIDTRKDPGLVRIEAGAEIDRDNHISITEVWENRKAFDQHEAAAHTRQFHQQADPLLGSPYDERIHQGLE